MTVNDSSRGVPSFLDFPPSPCHAMLGRLTYDSEKAILSLSLVFSEFTDYTEKGNSDIFSSFEWI